MNVPEKFPNSLHIHIKEIYDLSTARVRILDHERSFVDGHHQRCSNPDSYLTCTEVQLPLRQRLHHLANKEEECKHVAMAMAELRFLASEEIHKVCDEERTQIR